MNPTLLPVLRRVVAHLADTEPSHAVVGGLALSFRAEPRYTRDIDLAVAVTSDAEAEAVVGSLIRLRYRVDLELDHIESGRLSTMRLKPPAEADVDSVDQPYIDLLFTTCGIEPEVVAQATPLEIEPGLVLPIARVPHLMAMKLLAAGPHRKQDYVDLDDLLAEADDAEVAEVRELITLIHDRGFDRGLDLHARLDALLADYDRAG